MHPTVALSWSGGIDSTSCLWQLLRDGKAVLAHHVVLKTPEKRWEMESKAIKAQREWFAKHGYSFAYHESGYDYGTIRRFTRDINITSFIAGQVIAEAEHSEATTESFTAGHVLVGYPSVTQFVVSSSADDARRQSSDPNIQARRRGLTELIIGRKLEWLTPNIKKPKAQVMREMPPDLLELCWYCRRPINGMACGRCRTCREVAAARKAVGKGA